MTVFAVALNNSFSLANISEERLGGEWRAAAKAPSRGRSTWGVECAVHWACGLDSWQPHINNHSDVWPKRGLFYISIEFMRLI